MTPRYANLPPRPVANWWLRLASSGPRNPQRTLGEREAARRSDLIAWLALGLLGVVAIISPIAIDDFVALLVYLGFVAALVIVLALNRSGRIVLAGSLLVLFITGAILAYMLASPLGLTLGQLPNYDMLAVGVVVAASVLPRASAFVVAALNSIAIVADYLLQPHNRNLVEDAALYSSITQQTLSLVVRPIALQFVFAVVAYLWVRGVDRAIRRADRAEEMAVLERRERERTFALEEGVRYLHQTLEQWADGNVHHRVPPMPVEILQRVRDDLNAFVDRFSAMIQADFRLRRLQDEIARLTLALRDRAMGHPTILPAPSGTPLDEALALLRSNGGPASHGEAARPRGG